MHAEKLTTTKDVCQALYVAISLYHMPLEDMLLKDQWTGSLAPLSTLSKSEIARAYLLGYQMKHAKEYDRIQRLVKQHENLSDAEKEHYQKGLSDCANIFGIRLNDSLQSEYHETFFG